MLRVPAFSGFFRSIGVITNNFGSINSTRSNIPQFGLFFFSKRFNYIPPLHYSDIASDITRPTFNNELCSYFSKRSGKDAIKISHPINMITKHARDNCWEIHNFLLQHSTITPDKISAEDLKWLLERNGAIISSLYQALERLIMTHEGLRSANIDYPHTDLLSPGNSFSLRFLEDFFKSLKDELRNNQKLWFKYNVPGFSNDYKEIVKCIKFYREVLPSQIGRAVSVQNLLISEYLSGVTSTPYHYPQIFYNS